jgi:hypothetical protein
MQNCSVCPCQFFLGLLNCNNYWNCRCPACPLPRYPGMAVASPACEISPPIQPVIYHVRTETKLIFNTSALTIPRRTQENSHKLCVSGLVARPTHVIILCHLKSNYVCVLPGEIYLLSFTLLYFTSSPCSLLNVSQYTHCVLNVSYLCPPCILYVFSSFLPHDVIVFFSCPSSVLHVSHHVLSTCFSSQTQVFIVPHYFLFMSLCALFYIFPVSSTCPLHGPLMTY